MKNHRPVCSFWLSVVGCWRNTKGLPFSYLPTLAFALVLTLLLAPPCLSQQRWQRTYGGTSGAYGYSVQQTQDGGYIVVGYTCSYGYSDVYLIKTDSNGDTLWTRTYGGAYGEEGHSVRQTQDSGYIVAGITWSFGNYTQVYLLKTNAGGDTLWTRNYGGMYYNEGQSVWQTSDGGYLGVGGDVYFGDSTQVYLIKTNALGDSLWTRTYGGTGDDWGYAVQQTSDSGCIVAGITNSFGNGYQVYLIKTNAFGDTLWTRTYGGVNIDRGYSVQQTQDGGYIVAGYTGPYQNYDVYLIKTNAFGDTLWTRTYGGTGNDEGYSVQQTSDGGYIVAGYTASYGNGGSDVYLIKTNASGDTLWTRTYGGASSDYGFSVRQTTDGGYIVAGWTFSFGNGAQVYLIKTDSLGRSTGVEETTKERGQKLEVRMTVKPNPFTSFAKVPGQEKETFELYDIAGRRVGTYKGERIGWDTGPGVYFLRTSGKTTTPVRIVKVR